MNVLPSPGNALVTMTRLPFLILAPDRPSALRTIGRLITRNSSAICERGASGVTMPRLFRRSRSMSRVPGPCASAPLPLPAGRCAGAAPPECAAGVVAGDRVAHRGSAAASLALPPRQRAAAGVAARAGSPSSTRSDRAPAGPRAGAKRASRPPVSARAPATALSPALRAAPAASLMPAPARRNSSSRLAACSIRLILRTLIRRRASANRPPRRPRRTMPGVRRRRRRTERHCGGAAG